ncbi:SDR family oxidoreductase [Dactylosporangium salmoneum]|uniref:SDR family oxidoreductase n=1 Tax=Dactylosporangium salmoneum TaxID=53361 RepID=A0ABP5TVT1_9ACTN
MTSADRNHDRDYGRGAAEEGFGAPFTPAEEVGTGEFFEEEAQRRGTGGPPAEPGGNGARRRLGGPRLRPIEEQTVVITGASSGIGLVTARMAAARGARLVLVARNEEALRTLCDEIQEAGGEAAFVVADVGRRDDVARVARTAVETFGGFDTWVNNAGVSIFGQSWDVSLDDMHRVFDTVFWGVVHGSRAAVEQFRDTGRPGAIINVGSFLGERATPVQATYGSAKSAVHGFTEALRIEVAAARLPVSVTLVHPGRIDTPYNEHAESYLAGQPAHRGMLYPPEAVAGAILYAAAHPKRDLYVGGQAKVLTALANVAPKLTDRMIRRYAYWSQRTDRPSAPREASALWHAGDDLHERGSHEGWVRRRSYYVVASTHPVVASTMALAAAAGATTLVLRRMRDRW